MTVMTADIMEATEARRRVDRIRAGLDDIRDEVIALWRGQGWLALDYPTWAEMCTAEFPFRLALPQSERIELQATWTEAGLSRQAQAEALGVSDWTIKNDRRQGGISPPAKVTGLDGKEYRRPEPRQTIIDSATGEVLDFPLGRQSPATPPDPERERREEERRRQRVATALLCEHVVAIAQTLDTDVPGYYNPHDAIPGRAVTLDVITKAQSALEAIAKIWHERSFA